MQYPGGKAELYRLDPVGNRTGERELSGAALSAAELRSFEPPAGATLVRDVTGTFNRADWLLSLADAKDSARAVSLGWTASGELLTKTTATVSRRLTWDGRGALVTVADNGTEVGRYDYDANGQREKRRAAAENVEYVLDDTHVLQETDANVLEHPAYRRYHYGAEPLMVVDGARARFIGTDALGSPTDLTGTTGQVEAKRQYDAWGRYRNGTAPGAGEAKLGFTGHQFDPETGLVYARARYYDPEIGRFVSRDSFEGTLGDAPSLHRFAYAWGNPLRYWDRTGFCTEGDDAGCDLSPADEAGAFWDSVTSDETREGARQRRAEEKNQRSTSEAETTVKEDREAPGTNEATPGDAEDAGAEALAAHRQTGKAIGEAFSKARPVVQAAVEFVFSGATAVATLETEKSFWGQEATPEQIEQAKITLAANVAAPAVLAGAAKLLGKAWGWTKSAGGSAMARVRESRVARWISGHGDDVARVEASAAGGVEMVAPAALRWTQRTAGGNGRATGLRESMAARGYAGDPIDVVRTADGLVTVDHTRAAVAIELGIESIPARVHLPGDALPGNMAGRFGSATTWGEAAAFRAAGQRPPLPPTGTLTPPRLPR